MSFWQDCVREGEKTRRLARARQVVRMLKVPVFTMHWCIGEDNSGICAVCDKPAKGRWVHSIAPEDVIDVLMWVEKAS